MYTSLAANDFVVTVVTKDHFEPGAYSHMESSGRLTLTTKVPENRYGYTHTELFRGVLEGYNSSANNYEDLTPSECTKLYNTDYISSHRNRFLITNHRSNNTHNNTLLDMINVRSEGISPSSWMCAYYLAGEAQVYMESSFTCSPSNLTLNVTLGGPWRVMLTTGEEVEIGGCKSERTTEKCKVQFSLGIMIVVICCNLVKACCMVMAVVRSREPTLVTLGDAIDSFLRILDSTTVGICFADQEFIEREWTRGWRTGPRQWKQKGVQRWFTSVRETWWINCTIFYSMPIIVTGAVLTFGMNRDGRYWSNDLKSM